MASDTALLVKKPAQPVATKSLGVLRIDPAAQRQSSTAPMSPPQPDRSSEGWSWIPSAIVGHNQNGCAEPPHLRIEIPQLQPTSIHYDS